MVCGYRFAILFVFQYINMKVFVVLTLFVGMALIIHGIYEEKFLEMNKNVRVEYRFLPRTLYEEQLSKQDPALTAKFKNMFQEDSPWK